MLIPRYDSSVGSVVMTYTTYMSLLGKLIHIVISMITLASAYSGNHKRVKHYLTRINFMIEEVKKCNVVLKHVSTDIGVNRKHNEGAVLTHVEHTWIGI